MPKLTQAQNLLLQGVLPVLGAALVTAVTAGFQLVFQGHLDWNTLFVFILVSFLNGAQKALSAYIPAHIPQELQALADTQGQLLTLVQQQQRQLNDTTLSSLPAIPPSFPGPLAHDDTRGG